MEFLALVSEWPQAKQKVAKIFRNYTAFGKYMKVFWSLTRALALAVLIVFMHTEIYEYG